MLLNYVNSEYFIRFDDFNQTVAVFKKDIDVSADAKALYRWLDCN